MDPTPEEHVIEEALEGMDLISIAEIWKKRHKGSTGRAHTENQRRISCVGRNE